NVHVVAVVTNVDSTGSDESHFNYIGSRDFILNTQIVLADQRGLNMVVVRRIKVGAGQSVEIVPSRQQSQRAILERALQTGNIVPQIKGFGARSPFRNGRPPPF